MINGTHTWDIRLSLPNLIGKQTAEGLHHIFRPSRSEQIMLV
jgi:hypothetical protein